MKKPYLIFLIVPILVAIWIISSLTRNGVGEYDFRYNVLEDGTVKIISFSGDAMKVEIPPTLGGHTVSTIGDYAFYYKVPTQEVTIPDSITILEANPFLRCEQLKKISVSPEHPTLAIVDGVLVDKTQDKIISWPRASGTFSIPEGYSVIGEYAYGSGETLTEVVIPDGVITIDKGAFYYCTALTDVSIPDGVTSIGEEAFMECNALININIPDGVASIGPKAFNRCKSLDLLVIPDSVTFIGRDAFLSCYGLTLSVGKGSYAEQYAVENEIPFIYTEPAA